MGVAIMGSLLAMSVGRSVNAAILETDGAKDLPKEVLLALENPQLLIDSESRIAIHDSLKANPGSAEAFIDLVEVLRVALSEAISDVFLLSMVFVVIAFLSSFFVKEIALKGKKP